MPKDVNDKLAKFFSRFRLKNYSQGTTIIQAGSNPGGVFYLVSGQVRQFDISESGQKVTLNIFKPYAFFPMSWAINGTVNKYFFEALEDCRIKLAPADKTVEFLKENPDVAFDLLARVYRGTDGLLGRQLQLMTGSAYDRLGYELLVCCQRFYSPAKTGHYQIKIKETDLASLTGLARETVSRQLKKMSSAGLIELKAGQIIIENISKLKNRFS